MGVVTLQGECKDAYMRDLLSLLELGQDALTHSDLGYLASVYQIVDFGKELQSFDHLDVDEVSGLPKESVMTYLRTHQQCIERENPALLEQRQRIIAEVQDRMYRNEFAQIQDSLGIREALLTERLRDIAFFTGLDVAIAPGEPLDAGRRYEMTVRGYDLVKAAWVRYDLQLYKTEDALLRRNPYIADEQDSTVVRSWRSLRGGAPGVQVRRPLHKMINDLFGLTADQWFKELNATQQLRVGKIRRQLLAGFYRPDLGTEADLSPLIKDVPGAAILDLYETEREDTDVTLSDDFTAEFFDNQYAPELIIEERRRLLTTAPAAERLRAFAQRAPYRCEVLVA